MANAKDKLPSLPKGFTSGFYEDDDGNIVLVGLCLADPECDVRTGKDQDGDNFKCGSDKGQIAHNGKIYNWQVLGYRNGRK